MSSTQPFATRGELSARAKARLAGLFYLLTGGTAFAFFVRSKLIVPNDPAATTANILSHEALFRTALAADILGVGCYLVVTALFYELFKAVNRHVSLLAAFFSLMGCALQTVACIFHFAALGTLHSHVLTAEQSQSTALMLLRLQGAGFGIAILFFGLYCLLIGYLVFRSAFLPRILGLLMSLGGMAYVINSLAAFLSASPRPHLASAASLLGGIGEGALLLWLLIMGVDAHRWKEQAAAAASASA